MANRLVLTAVCALVVALATTMPHAASPQSAPPPDGLSAAIFDEHSARAALDRYCVMCHNQRLSTAGLALDTANVANVATEAELWEKVVRKLQTRAMPPQGMPRPNEAAYHGVLAWLVTELDRAAAAHPNPGRPLLRRLNRSEYGNAIRDLLALDVDVTALLPPDDSAYGFDNIADMLGVSPTLQERYLSAAAKISASAIGDSTRGPIGDTYRVRQDFSQNQHVEGLPFGTLGGLLVRHVFPLDGEYLFQVRLQHTNFGNLRGLDYPHQVETTVDGERVHVATIGGDADLTSMFESPQTAGEAIEARLASARVRVQAGPRSVGVAFIRNLALGDTRRLQPFLRSSANTLDWTGLPHIQSLTITGPFNPSGPGDTPSRRRIFVCHPAAAAAELPCAEQILQTIARRAYRQPVGDADLRPLLAFYHRGRAEGTFETGIQRALQAVLASPRFIFRVERDPDGVPPGGIYRISGVELASRLAFFLWSSIPDDELLRVASQQELHEPAVLEQQVRRMLADPKSQALVTNFAGQWLQLRNVRSVMPNSDEFPDFDDNLRQAFRRETELFVTSILREDRTVLDLLGADYTFVNERLARHYGIPQVYGSRFRRVPVAETRRGLLGHGSILALTSHAERTAPVLRGKWVLENIIGTPPPAPPPDIPALMENQSGGEVRTMRETLMAHRANPACAACHNVMDPIGFALENFDAVGAWRTREPGGPIDTSGELADGTDVDGVVALRNALLRRPDVFVTTMAEKLLTYALGRGLEASDMPAVRAIVRSSASSEYRFSSVVMGVVNSTPFQMRIRPIDVSDDPPVSAALR